MPTPSGEKITLTAGKLSVPDHPIVPFIEGDGTGRDIWRASEAVFDAAVQKAYGGKRKIAWHEVLAGEKAFKAVNNWLPDATIEASETIWSASRGRSPRRSAAASARSMSRSDRCSTFTSACDRCAISVVFPLP